MKRSRGAHVLLCDHVDHVTIMSHRNPIYPIELPSREPCENSACHTSRSSRWPEESVEPLRALSGSFCWFAWLGRSRSWLASSGSFCRFVNHDTARGFHIVTSQTVLTRLSFQYSQPLEPICYCCRGIVDCLERYVTWPREFGHAIWNGQNSCPQP